VTGVQTCALPIFLAQQDIYSTLYIGKPEQVVAIERLPGYWLDEQLVLPVRDVHQQED
jgi:hypothetical protein